MSPDEGDRAGKTYQNVQVLGYASTDDFNRIMLSMNAWIGTGEQGCNYCHNPENMASDEKYTKVVARRMLQMTQNINNNWTQHVHATGVTCWTCHRGNAGSRLQLEPRSRTGRSAEAQGAEAQRRYAARRRGLLGPAEPAVRHLSEHQPRGDPCRREQSLSEPRGPMPIATRARPTA